LQLEQIVNVKQGDVMYIYMIRAQVSPCPRVEGSCSTEGCGSSDGCLFVCVCVCCVFRPVGLCVCCCVIANAVCAKP